MALGSAAELVAAAAPADALYARGPVNLGEEGRQWVLAADAVALLLHELEPLAVMDLTTHAPVRLKHSDCDLLQPLTAQSRRELLDTELGGDAESAGELLEQMLVAPGAVFELIDHAAQPVGLLALLGYPGEQHLVLGPQGGLQIRVDSTASHNASVRVAADGTPEAAELR